MNGSKRREQIVQSLSRNCIIRPGNLYEETQDVGVGDTRRIAVKETKRLIMKLIAS